ncbi:C-type Lectin CRL-like [Ahaetulla prasina]|uniref:C-type Lectin CRL-like n=1 Tax=Ahaetulla prasina TaxID=499056 RepID=UPI00264894F7|nr:C-type Lectin CRL-like [Ahaetulla prasina]
MSKSFNHSVLIFWVANFIISGIEAIRCPLGWFTFQNKCYGFHSIPQSWKDAETYCQQYSQQAHLASIVSKMEQEMIATHISTNHFTRKGVWIGLYDSCMKKCWKWTDYSSISYVSWEATFPKPRDYLSCIQLSATSGFQKWRNRNCSKKAQFLCMFRA